MLQTFRSLHKLPMDEHRIKGRTGAKHRILPLITTAGGILVAVSAVTSFNAATTTSAVLHAAVQLNHKTMTLQLFACVAFVFIAAALSRWPLTRRTGSILIGRVINAVENWERETLRSFVEMFVWLGVSWSTFGATSRCVRIPPFVERDCAAHDDRPGSSSPLPLRPSSAACRKWRSCTQAATRTAHTPPLRAADSTSHCCAARCPASSPHCAAISA